MASITGGNVMPPTGGALSTGVRQRITWLNASPVGNDLLVSGESDTVAHTAYRTVVDTELACDMTTGYIYERAAGIWARKDTL
jgi:hypothetical protein